MQWADSHCWLMVIVIILKDDDDPIDTKGQSWSIWDVWALLCREGWGPICKIPEPWAQQPPPVVLQHSTTPYALVWSKHCVWGDQSFNRLHLTLTCLQTSKAPTLHRLITDLRGGINKKKLFFFQKNSKRGGGVSPNPKFPYQKKLRFFLEKGGGLTYSKRVLSQKTGDFGLFLPKRGVI